MNICASLVRCILVLLKEKYFAFEVGLLTVLIEIVSSEKTSHLNNSVLLLLTSEGQWRFRSFLSNFTYGSMLVFSQAFTTGTDADLDGSV